jgi:U3 small nucleolar RNA-associated protein 22
MDAAYKLAYSQPSNINVVGSYSLKTLTKRDHPLAVDMIVTLPTSILQEKDYLNYRYIYKKAYYLACLAAGLREKCGDEFEFQFEYLGENTLQPILTLKPGRSKFNWSVPFSILN